MSRIALIDGDTLLYRAGFAVEKVKYLVELPFEFDPNSDSPSPTFIHVASWKDAKEYGDKVTIWTRKEIGSLEDAISRLNATIERICTRVQSSQCFTYLSPNAGNFRDSLGTIRKYKGNRDSTSRPFYYGELREHLIKHHRATVAVGEEADDMLSWVANKYGERSVVCGTDKDLEQIPGVHYNYDTDELYSVSEVEAGMAFWMQVLCGDPGDNVPGCWKMGFTKAKNRVADWFEGGLSEASMWEATVLQYKNSQKLKECPYKDKDPEAVALETARLVRLRREPDEKLWTPRKAINEKTPIVVSSMSDGTVLAPAG